MLVLADATDAQFAFLNKATVVAQVAPDLLIF
jgi:hypothetical protein